MKIVMLDFNDGSVRLHTVDKEHEKEAEDMSLDVDAYLAEKGFYTPELSCMLCDDEVPVYYDNASIPVTKL